MTKLAMLRAQREAAFEQPAVSTAPPSTVSKQSQNGVRSHGADEGKAGRPEIERAGTHPFDQWAGTTPLISQTKSHIGRPRIEDRQQTLAATRPWEVAGMSRSTWFRRQAQRGAA
jgi:hypothetical protein